MRQLLQLTLVLVVFSCIAVSAQTTTSVSIMADDQPVSAILNNMARQTGMTIRLAPGINQTVSLSVEKMSIVKALNSLTDAADNLRWRKIWVNPEASNADIEASVRAIDSKPPITVVLEGPSGTTKGVVTGQLASDLKISQGLKPVFWVSLKNSEIAKTSATTASTSATTETKEEYTASSVEKNVGQWLSVLQPLQALQVVDNLRSSIERYLTPYDLQIMNGDQYNQPLVPTFGNSRLRFSNPASNRVRVSIPGSGGGQGTAEPDWTNY